MPLREPIYQLNLLHPATRQVFGELEDYQSFTWTRKWQALGDFELRLPGGSPWHEALTQPNVGIEIVRDGMREEVYYVCAWHEHYGPEDETGDVTVIRGWSAPTYIVARMALPAPLTTTDASTTAGADVDAVTGTVVTGIRTYVDHNLISSGESSRNVSGLALGSLVYPSRFPNTSPIKLPEETIEYTAGWYGAPDNPTIILVSTWKARYDPLWLKITEMAQLGNVGFRFRLDTVTGGIYFDVLLLADRTVGNLAGFSEIVFSSDRDTLATFDYDVNGMEAINTVYAAADGASTTRIVVTVQYPQGSGIPNAVNDWVNPDPFGNPFVLPSEQRVWGRMEAAIDTRQAGSSPTDSATLANAFLAEHAVQVRAEFAPNETETQRYLQHYDLGHKVTAVMSRAGRPERRGNGIITEVRGELTADASPKITVSVGYRRQTLAKAVSEIDQASGPARYI